MKPILALIFTTTLINQLNAQAYETKVGEIKKVRLDTNVQATINAATRIRYNRSYHFINLSGEIYIVNGTNNTIGITAKNLNVILTPQSIANVSSYENDEIAIITVYKGEAIDATSRNQQTIKKGQIGIVKNNALEISTDEPDRDTSWLKKRPFIRKRTAKGILALLERYYPYKIIVSKECETGCNLEKETTGTIPPGAAITTILNVLKFSYDNMFTYMVENNVIQIKPAK